MLVDSPGPQTIPLCHEHHGVIREHFRSWVDQVEADGADPIAQRQRLSRLYVMARAHPTHGWELYCQLAQEKRDNHFARWEAKIKQAQRLWVELKPLEAAALLSDQLIDTAPLTEFGFRHMAATTHFYLSLTHLGMRRRDDAMGHGQRALSITREIRDHPSFHTRYWENLADICRYFGDGDAAAVHAEGVAEVYADIRQAALSEMWLRRARLLREGEPVVRAIVEAGGVEYEAAEVPDESLANGFSVRLVRNRPLLNATVAALMAHGDRACLNGDADVAMSSYLRAAAADPHDPEPLRRIGAVALREGLSSQAIEAFEGALSVAPGWTGCRAGLWIATQVQLGRISPVGLDINAVRWTHVPVKARLEAAQRATRDHACLAFFWLALGRLQRAEGKTDEAERSLRSGLDLECDESTRTELLVALAGCYPKADRRTPDLLKQAVALNGDPKAVVTARLLLRATT